MKQNFIQPFLVSFFCFFAIKVQSLCSIYCPFTACNGTNYNSCQSCDEVFALNSSMIPNCQPYPPTGYVFEAESDNGLIMTYPSSTQTDCSSITNIKGWFSPTQSVQVKYPGVTRPYQSIKIFFGIVAKGTWVGPQIIQMYFQNMGDLKSRSIFTRDYALNGKCSSDLTDYRYRIRQDYTYTTENVELNWEIRFSGANGSTNGYWAITQVLLLLQACDRRCLVCTTSPTTCTSCVTFGTYQSFLVTSNLTCVDAPSCPISTYAQTSTHICENCNRSNCITCTTKNVCTQCATSYFLNTLDNSCVTTCPNGFYANSAVTPNTCSQCPSVCTKCTSNTTCSECTTNGTYESFLTGTSCVPSASCPAGTFADTATHFCAGCNSSCSTCSGNINNCTACISTLFYLSNICYSTCPNGYYGNTVTGNCATCDSKCTICTTSATACTACTTNGTNQSFLTGTSCVPSASCPAGSFPDTSTHVCAGCNSSCSTCSGNINSCTSCISSLFYLSNVCYSTCPNGYYGNTVTGNCVLCDLKCTACTTSVTTCTACTTNGTYESFLTGTSCVSSVSCPTGTFADTASHMCTTCNSSCSTCSDNINNCTACISTLFYLSNICYSTCPNGYYGNTVTGNCVLCDLKCAICTTSATTCSACTTNGTYESFLTGTSCVPSASCPAGTFADISTHACTTCNSSCSTCSGNINNCTACISTLFYLSNVCYSTCPNGYYGNTVTGNCATCDSKCTICTTSATACTACTTNGTYESFLSGSSCVASASCPGGTFPDTSTHVCTTCNSSCATCQGALDNCTSCVLGLFYLNNVCYSLCPNPYYNSAPATKQCLLCNSKCTICSVSSTNCTACTTSGANQAFLISATNTCVVGTSCPSGSYPEPSTHVCTACNSSCLTCQVNADNCTSCILGLFYLNNVCYTVCPAPYYNSAPATKQCLLCNAKCTVCNVTSTNCSACTITGANQAFLNTVTSSCVTLGSCPLGTFGNAVNHVCDPCNSSCYNCTGTADNCLWCASPLYLLTNICYTVCPVSYYGTSGKCILCNSLCLTCTGTAVSQCLSCKTVAPYQSFYLSTNKTCYTDCPMGYFQVFSTHLCQKCDISCSSCTNDPSPCQSCNSSYAYFNETCLAACPAGYWAKPTPPLTYKVCTPCTIQCLTCYGGLDSQCYTCNFDLMVKKSGSYCRPNCMPGWGDIKDSQNCAYCNQRCVSCYNNGNNCTSCKTSGSNEGFMIITDFVANTGNCYGVCPNGYFGNKTSHFCDQCTSPCKTCNKLTTNCTSCIVGFYYLNLTCYSICPDGYFINGTNCSLCQPQCSICSVTSDNCSLCNKAYPAYLLNYSCLSNCPSGYYKNSDNLTNNYTCDKCEPQCKTCSGIPSPCFSCNPSFFYFQQTCNSTCTTPGYFGDIVTWQCALCDLRCVRLDLKMSFQNQLDQAIIVTFKFTQDLDWSTFPFQTFQSFQFDDPFFTIDMFDLEYSQISGSCYQIRITPKLYIFMYNLGITVTVMPMPFPNMQALNKRPFHETVYNQTESLVWSQIKAPGVSDNQKQMILNMLNFTGQLQKFTNLTGVREIVQSGLLSWFLPGVQITSAVVLVNGIIPQHMYEGIRIMATVIFFQVPKWEKSANNTRYIFNQYIQDLIPETLSKKFSLQYLDSLNETSRAQLLEHQYADNAVALEISKRRTLQANLPDDWRFKRTGFSTFFILDIYMQIILIAAVWIILLIMIKCVYKKDRTNRNVARAYIIFHKVHEISLMYVTIALVLQWIYFDQQIEQTYRWLSFSVCLLMLVYFLCYQLYIYYDLFQYPQAHVNNRSYLIYVTKYGCLLSKIRYEQYDINQEWSPKVWFRPYNYHILSFYKKFMMMFALPIFHQMPYAQAASLILLQLLEIVRFVATWPFNSKLRNLYRILLEVCLLIIFIIVLVTQYLSRVLMENNPNTIENASIWFNNLGWIGLILVLVFNFSIFLINIIDTIRLFTKGNHLVQMDEIRRQYYWEKVKKYEDENKDIKIQVISKWVKLGNLRQLENVHDEANYVTVKIQKLKIQKYNDFFNTHITHVSQLKIQQQGLIYQQNCRRLRITKKIRKIVEISQESDKQFFKTFKKIYEKYKIQQEFKKAKLEQKISLFDKNRDRDIYEVVVQTFIKINLNQYPDGGRVFFYKNMLRHVISLYLNENKVLKIKQEEVIDGLPLDNKLLSEGYIFKKKGGKYNSFEDTEKEQLNVDL